MHDDDVSSLWDHDWQCGSRASYGEGDSDTANIRTAGGGAGGGRRRSAAPAAWRPRGFLRYAHCPIAARRSPTRTRPPRRRARRPRPAIAAQVSTASSVPAPRRLRGQVSGPRTRRDGHELADRLDAVPVIRSRQVAALEDTPLRGGELVGQIVFDEIVLGGGDGLHHLVVSEVLELDGHSLLVGRLSQEYCLARAASREGLMPPPFTFPARRTRERTVRVDRGAAAPGCAARSRRDRSLAQLPAIGDLHVPLPLVVAQDERAAIVRDAGQAHSRQSWRRSARRSPPSDGRPPPRSSRRTTQTEAAVAVRGGPDARCRKRSSSGRPRSSHRAFEPADRSPRRRNRPAPALPANRRT